MYHHQSKAPPLLKTGSSEGIFMMKNLHNKNSAKTSTHFPERSEFWQSVSGNPYKIWCWTLDSENSNDNMMTYSRLIKFILFSAWNNVLLRLFALLILKSTKLPLWKHRKTVICLACWLDWFKQWRSWYTALYHILLFLFFWIY